MIDTYLNESDDFSELVAFLHETTDIERINYEISPEELQLRTEFAGNFMMLLKE